MNHKPLMALFIIQIGFCSTVYAKEEKNVLEPRANIKHSADVLPCLNDLNEEKEKAYAKEYRSYLKSITPSK